MIRTTVFTFCVVALFSVITELKSHAVVPVGEFHHFMSNFGECECGISPVPKGPKIINGYEAPHDKYPWMVVLFADGIQVCEGTIITPYYVLTAAHCLDGKAMVRQYTIGLIQHSSKWMESMEIIDITYSIMHPDFHSPRWENDIALLQLGRPIKCSEFRRPICLADKRVPDLRTGSSVILTGWGRTRPTIARSSSLLREGRVIVQQPKYCYELGGWNKSTQLCAKGEFLEACKGDSGGPLMELVNGRYYNYGVVSHFKYGGCNNAEPLYYSNVKLYIDWIHRAILDRHSQELNSKLP